jgi:hypothetical protein
MLLQLIDEFLVTLLGLLFDENGQIQRILQGEPGKVNRTGHSDPFMRQSLFRPFRAAINHLGIQHKLNTTSTRRKMKVSL